MILNIKDGHEENRIAAKGSPEKYIALQRGGLFMSSLNPETPVTVNLSDQFKKALAIDSEYHRILDILPDIVYKIDPDGYFTFLSKSIELLDYTQDELIGKHFSVIVHPEDLPNISRKIVLPRFKGKNMGAIYSPKLFDERRSDQRITRGLIIRLLKKNALLSEETSDNYSLTGEVCAKGLYNEANASAHPERAGCVDAVGQTNRLQKNGKVCYVEIANYGRYDGENSCSNKHFLGTVGVIRDISDRKKLEQKQIELDQQILHAKKMEAIGILAGGIAHDFNNLLQGVFGYISMAKMNFDQPEKCLAMLEQAEKALNMSVDLTTQLLTFSKGGKPAKKRMMVHPIVENSAKFALSGSRTDYSIENDSELEMVEADEGQISQVIQNIIMNADHAMPASGTVLITVQKVCAPGYGIPPSLAAGYYIRISIKDNGIGIPEHYLQRIFEPYFTTKDKGSGLGLATSYSIIHNHGGMIDVKSELGKGSTFSIYLPAADGEEQIIQSVPAPFTNIREGWILLMDDEQLIRDTAGAMIKALGHRVEFAFNGEEAVDKYREAMSSSRRFDVVILDLTIRGGMGGEEAVKKLLGIDPDVKAVVSSGYAECSVMTEYAKCGFTACLKKPYQLDTLRNTLHDLLR